MNYWLVISIVLSLSFIFSLAGVGSATAIIPILVFLGESFNMAKNAGLFINVLSSSASTMHHHTKGKMEWKTALLIAIPAFLLAPMGAMFSQILSHETLLLIFSIFLIYSATVLIFLKRDGHNRDPNIITLISIGSLAGFFAGLLGIGGGALVSPLLAVAGKKEKRIARITPIAVLLSSLSGFFTYTLMGYLDLILVATVAIPAVIGGYLGAHMMHYKLSSKHLKIIIGIIFYLLAAKALVSII